MKHIARRQLLALVFAAALIGPAFVSAAQGPLAGNTSPMEMARVRDASTHQLTTFDQERRSKTVNLPRGERVTIGEVEGTGFVNSIWLTFPGWFWKWWEPQDPTRPELMKMVILRLYWDGADKPAVEAPIADFFGVGLCQESNFASKYFGMSSGAFFCKFPMPFRKGFRVELQNIDATMDTRVFMNVLYQLDDHLPDDAAYFHAQFHTAVNDCTDPVDLAQFNGRGHFVGCTLAMQSEESRTFSHLESPEYVYIDDDWETPRFTGTGLEDYFLGGWYFRQGAFIGPLHGVPIKDFANASITMYRVHEADAYHFTRRFRMEFVNPWSADRLRPHAYSSVAFAYIDTPQGQNPPMPGRDDLLCWYRIHNPEHITPRDENGE